MLKIHFPIPAAAAAEAAARCWSDPAVRSAPAEGPALSDSAVVRLPPDGLGQRLHHEEGDGAQEAHHHQDEQLPVQQQVVAVGERHRGHDGLRRGKRSTGEFPT